jgi:hypothetical protein
MLSTFVHKLYRTLSAGLALTLLAGATLAASPLPAYAAGDTPPTPPAPDAAARSGATLEHLNQREQTAMGIQADHLAKAGEVAGKVQEWIDKLAEQGQDVTDLEAALASFKDSLGSAQSPHDQAAGILDTHAGFDGNGKVTDLQAARETVRSAGQALRECRRTLLQAARDLRQAVRTWRQAHRPSPSSSSLPSAAPSSAG